MKWRVTEYGWYNIIQLVCLVGFISLAFDFGGWRTFFVAFFFAGCLTMAEFMGEHRARGYGTNSFEERE
jgi:hypothetical protein